MERYEEILEFWFEGIDEDSDVGLGSQVTEKWFGSDPQFDKELKKLFEGDLKKAQIGEYDHWESDPRGRLALILLFDQFPRNMYRGSAKAFENDLKALELGLKSAKDGFDGRVYFVERIFYYLPLMHAESAEVQAACIALFQKLVDEASRYEDQNVLLLQLSLAYAERHQEVYSKFNRFPGRNDALKRRSTSEERDFLQDPENHF